MKIHKKSLLITLTLALVFVMGISGTSFAANFSDVPNKHWAYDAVSQLAKAGLVEGYGDNTFRGDKTLTRYEFAFATARALEKYNKADAQQKALLDKLSVEFVSELNNIGVRLAKLEKNASSVKITGDARIRNLHNWNLAGTDAAGSQSLNWLQQRIRLNVGATVSDTVDFTGRITANNTSNYFAAGSTNSKTGLLTFDTARFTFKGRSAGNDVSVGREALGLGATSSNGDIPSPNAIVANSPGFVDNIRVNFKNGKASGFVAVADLTPLYDGAIAIQPTTATGSKNVKVAKLVWDATKGTRVTGGVLSSNGDSYQYKQSFIGVAHTFAKDWTVIGDYVKNSYAGVTTQNSGVYGALNYKGADFNKAGSWGAYVDYRKIGANAVDLYITGLNSHSPTQGEKGFGVGFGYTITKNAKFTASVEHLKSYEGTTQYAPNYNLRAEFVF